MPDSNKHGDHKRGNQITVDPEEIQEELRRLAMETGRTPTTEMMANRGAYSVTTVGERFGSWNDALRSIDHTPNTNWDVQDQAVTAEIVALADELGHPPTASDFRSQAKFSVKCAQLKFGSWNEALRAAGFKPNKEHKISDDALLQAIRSLAETLGKVPTAAEMNEHGDYSQRCYFDRWDGWQAAVRAAGYEPVGYPSGPDNPRWKEQTAEDWRDYGPNWQTQRERALERDSHTCQTPGCERTTESHREEFGMGLAVHHIRPLGTFGATRDEVDFEQANRLGNLVTVCNLHHHLWERASPLRIDTREITR